MDEKARRTYREQEVKPLFEQRDLQLEDNPVSFHSAHRKPHWKKTIHYTTYQKPKKEIEKTRRK
jgi:hypothetical protein